MARSKRHILIWLATRRTGQILYEVLLWDVPFRFNRTILITPQPLCTFVWHKLRILRPIVWQHPDIHDAWKKRVFFHLNFCAAVCEYFRKISTAEKSPLSPITSTFVKIYSISLKSGTLPSGGFFPIFFSTFYIFIFNFHKMWNTDQICESLFNFVQSAASCDPRGFYARCGTFFKQALHIFTSFPRVKVPLTIGSHLDDFT